MKKSTTPHRRRRLELTAEEADRLRAEIARVGCVRVSPAIDRALQREWLRRRQSPRVVKP